MFVYIYICTYIYTLVYVIVWLAVVFGTNSASNAGGKIVIASARRSRALPTVFPPALRELLIPNTTAYHTVTN